jgi:hypothetical protein
MIATVIVVTLLFFADVCAMQQLDGHEKYLMAIISQHTRHIIATPPVEQLPDLVCVQHVGEDSGEIHWLEGKKLAQNNYAVAKTCGKNFINFIAYKKNAFTLDPHSFQVNDTERSVSALLKRISDDQGFVIQSTIKDTESGMSNNISINGSAHLIYTDEHVVPVIKILPLTW